MEVELKLRLPDAAAHQRLSDFLASRHLRNHAQENLFFDAAGSPLAAATAALRLRFYNGDARCVLSLKRRPALAAGVSRVEESEEDLDPALARACAAEPSRLAALDSAIIRAVADEFGVGGGDAPFVCLGGFRNVRAVYAWEEEGLVIELDETRFAFGTSYEVECETTEPERVRERLEAMMREAGVPYEYAKSSKFGTFLAGRLLP